MSFSVPMDLSPTAAPKCSPSSPICVPSSSFPFPHASVSTSTVVPAEPATLSSKIRPADDSEDTSRAAIEDTPHAAILRVDPNTPDNPRNISETTISAPPISPFPNSPISHRDASTVQLLADEVSPLAGATAVSDQPCDTLPPTLCTNTASAADPDATSALADDVSDDELGRSVDGTLAVAGRNLLIKSVIATKKELDDDDDRRAATRLAKRLNGSDRRRHASQLRRDG